MKKKIKVFDAVDIPKIYQNIFEAYHNDSDLLSELVQNAVDSVRMANPPNPLIEIKFDEINKKLSIKDNGIGISFEDLDDLALGRTQKKNHKDFSILGGEKGIGSAFIFGGSDSYFIESVKDKSLIIAECNGAYEKISNGEEPEFYVIDEESNDRFSNYTEIQVTGELFYLDFKSLDEIETMLRTFTAIGYTLPLFGKENLNIKIKLSWIDLKGVETVRRIDDNFRHPVNDLEDDIIEYSDIENIDTAFDSYLFYKSTDSQAIGIFGESSLFIENEIPTGIMLSVKGYPTAVEIPYPKTGYSGYWGRNIFILINDDGVSLDPGRKTIQKEDLSKIKKIAKEVFNKLIKYRKKFIKQIETEAEKVVLESLKKQANNLPDLKIDGIPFKKIPDYEQGVIALFHELLGSKKLEGYFPLSSSGDTRYDELVLYEVSLDTLGENYRNQYLKANRNIKPKPTKYSHEITIEYKLNLVEIFRDMKKELRFIDLLIAYDCNKSKMKKGWKLVELDQKEIIYVGANYLLRNPMNDSCHVMLLKDFVKPVQTN